MTGTDEPFKYKAMAAQIVSAEGMGKMCIRDRNGP